MKRLVCSLIVVLVTVSFAWAGGQQESEAAEGSGEKAEKVTLELFHYKETIVDGMNELAEAYMAKNPNVKISNEMLSTEYNTVLKSRDSAGNLPDIWAASSPGEKALKPYIEAGKIHPVNDLKVIKQLTDDVTESLTFSDGNIYTIPLLNTARGVIYNTELFEQAGIDEFPSTFTEMEAAVEKLKAQDIIPFAVAGKDGWTLGSLVFQCGAELYAKNNFAERMWAGEASHDEMREIFNFIDLFKANTQAKPMDADYMSSVALYAQEKAAMIIQGPWAMPAVADLAPEVVEVSRMEGIPYTEDADVNKLYFDYDIYFCVSTEENMDAVHDYCDFNINGEGREIFKEKIKAINPYGIEFEANPVVASINEHVQNNNTVGDTLYVNAPDGWWQTQAIVMQEYMGGQINKSEMIQKLDDEWLKVAEQQ
ncbi:MAG: ABC transporter substrate-binding protein [Spirochaetota bacterium]